MAKNVKSGNGKVVSQVIEPAPVHDEGKVTNPAPVNEPAPVPSYEERVKVAAKRAKEQYKNDPFAPIDFCGDLTARVILDSVKGVRSWVKETKKLNGTIRLLFKLLKSPESQEDNIRAAFSNTRAASEIGNYNEMNRDTFTGALMSYITNPAKVHPALIREVSGEIQQLTYKKETETNETGATVYKFTETGDFIFTPVPVTAWNVQKLLNFLLSDTDRHNKGN